jgi:hypothetical protein
MNCLRPRFKKDAPHKNNVFFKPCTKLTLHCNRRSGHLKTEHTESLLQLRRHLGNWSRGPAVSMRSEQLVAHEELEQFPLLSVYDSSHCCQCTLCPNRVRNKFFINILNRTILLCILGVITLVKQRM